MIHSRIFSTLEVHVNIMSILHVFIQQHLKAWKLNPIHCETYIYLDWYKEHVSIHKN